MIDPANEWGFSFLYICSMSVPTVILEGDKKNIRQVEYFTKVMTVAILYQQIGKHENRLSKISPDHEDYTSTVEKLNELKKEAEDCLLYFFYGGAIRGGKTTIALALLVILCKMFPKSKWAVIRKSMPRLKETTIPALEKMVGRTGVYWKRSQAEYFCQFDNGSRIYFIAENYEQDKQLAKFLGMEMNGFLLEQMEELREEGYNMILSRAGSHYGVVGAMPPPLVLGTFNPTFAWVKRVIYDPWEKSKLEAPYSFTEALPDDNPWVTDAQWRVWETLDDDTYNRMIKGKWNIDVKKAFLWAFNKDRNTKPGLKLNFNEPIWISFDFNVDPMTCVIGQTDHQTYLRVTHAFKVPNSDTYDLCEKIKPIIEGWEHMVYVTGDASGKNRISGSKGHLNHYQIIRDELGLIDDQFKLLIVNPLISENRVFMNSLLQKFPEFLIDESLEELIKDVQFTVTDIDKDGEVSIKKTGTNEYLSVDNKTLGHLMDCLRYFATITLHKWVNIPRS